MAISDLFNQFPNENILPTDGETPEGIRPRISPSTLSFPSAYQFAKRFIKVPNSISSGGGITSIDDPTYLGFTLLFESDSPLFNGATTGQTEVSANPNTESPEDSAAAQTTAASGPSGESAVGYLEKIGETQRAKYLRAFVQGIQKINRERPYYFQTIDGIKDAWEKSINFSEDPYVGSTDDEGITIGCLEAVDLKITALFNLYKLAVYDSKYRRTIVPKNLLKFDVKVIVHEIRKFKTAVNYLNSLTNNPSEGTANFVNGNTSAVTFKFKKCMWKASESGNVFDTVSNSEAQVATTAIKFSYSNVIMDGSYSGYSVDLDEGESQKPTIINDILKGKDLKPYAESQINGVLDTVQQRARSFGESQILGNAFGLTNQTLGVLDNPQALANALNGAALNALNDIPGSGNPTNSLGGQILPPGRQPTNGDGGQIQTSISGDKIFEDVVDPSKGFTSGNLFSNRPSGPGPLQSTNVFE